MSNSYESSRANNQPLDSLHTVGPDVGVAPAGRVPHTVGVGVAPADRRSRANNQPLDSLHTVGVKRVGGKKSRGKKRVGGKKSRGKKRVGGKKSRGKKRVGGK
jgi:hypothetical protein